MYTARFLRWYNSSSTHAFYIMCVFTWIYSIVKVWPTIGIVLLGTSISSSTLHLTLLTLFHSLLSTFFSSSFYLLQRATVVSHRLLRFFASPLLSTSTFFNLSFCSFFFVPDKHSTICVRVESSRCWAFSKIPSRSPATDIDTKKTL